MLSLKWAKSNGFPASTTMSARLPARSVEQLVRIAGELGRAGATGKEARDVYKLDEHYDGAEETLAKCGFPPGC
jgi:hypothetical protein